MSSSTPTWPDPDEMTLSTLRKAADACPVDEVKVAAQSAIKIAEGGKAGVLYPIHQSHSET